MKNDRRAIVPFLARWFPSLEKASSDDVGAFLDKVTGVETDPAMPNGEAFDRWREKLAGLGYPVFRYTPERIAAMNTKADAMLTAEKARAASLGKTLSDLAKEAPNWPVADMLARKKG